MRLGGQACRLVENSKAKEFYENEIIIERHRHRYEVNNELIPTLEQKGLQVAGRSLDGTLVEIIELKEHPWFVGCQFHPEFTSKPRKGHPLFISFVNAAAKHSQNK